MDYIKRCGVEIHYNSPIGGDRTINDLLTRDGFSAVFLGRGGPGFHPPAGAGLRGPGRALGRGIPERLGLGQEVRLRRARRWWSSAAATWPWTWPAPPGARAARRHPHLPGNPGRDARLPLGSGRGRARRRRRSSTAGASKRSTPPAARSPASTLRAVERVFDEQGRFSPTYFDDKTTTRDADVVIMAIGQKTNLKFITEADGIKLTPRGLIETDPVTKATSREASLPAATWRPVPGSPSARWPPAGKRPSPSTAILTGQDLKAGREPAGSAHPQGRRPLEPRSRRISRRSTGPSWPPCRWKSGSRVLRKSTWAISEEAGRGRSGPLHQLRRFAPSACSAPRPARPRPWPTTWDRKSWSWRWARSSWPRALRSSIPRSTRPITTPTIPTW